MHGAALRSEATLRCGDDVGPGLCNCTRTRFAAWSSPPPVKLVASRDGEMRDVGQGKVPEKAAVQDSHALGVRTCAVAGITVETRHTLNGSDGGYSLHFPITT